MTATPWAVPADAQTLLGRTVDAGQLAQAVTTIELHTGLIEAVERDDITDRDRYWLKLASCYQAVWLAAQPDALERNAVTSAGQDGQTANAGNADWLTLSPFARKAIKRLSFRGPRSILVDNTALRLRADALSEAYDDRLAWRPVG